MNKKKFLITGGAGFIGSAVVRHLIHDLKHEAIVLDKLTYAGSLKSLDSVKDDKNFFFEKADICNPKDVDRILKIYSPDIVMNLAAETHVDRSIDDPTSFVKTNINGTFVLLNKVLRYWNKLSKTKKKIFKFHQVSTDEVYGDLKGTSNLSNEDATYKPNSPYSASKAGADYLVRAWYKTYGLPIVITNSSNTYGPYHFPEKLIPLMILNALEGKKLPVYGQGKQIRDWLHVSDHARGLVIAATRGKKGETYNIGAENQIKNIEVIKAICELLEKLAPNKPKGVKKYIDLITYVKDRPGHDQRYAVSSTKIRKNFNWITKETFSSGLYKTVEWYLDNLEWCKHIQKNNYNRERLGIHYEGKKIKHLI